MQGRLLLFEQILSSCLLICGVVRAICLTTNKAIKNITLLPKECSECIWNQNHRQYCQEKKVESCAGFIVVVLHSCYFACGSKNTDGKCFNNFLLIVGQESSSHLILIGRVSDFDAT
jgi:hypothetical protein